MQTSPLQVNLTIKFSKITAGVMAAALILALLATSSIAIAGPQAAPQASGAPTVVSYQGKVMMGGVPYTGPGYFKFAFVASAGSTNYWANDGSASGEPTAAVQLSVANGLFSVLLGDTTLTNMTQPLDAGVFSATDRLLRVWFSSDGSDFTQLAPDQRVAAAAYAFQAQKAVDADTLDGKHATAFDLPTGAMVLGQTASESALTAAGFSYTGQWFDHWVTRAPMLTGRTDSAAAAVNNEIYVFGGAGNNATNEAYDTNTDSWSTRAPMITGRSHMAVAEVNGVIYAIGGISVASNYETTVEAYYPITNTWVAKAPMPTGRRAAAAAVVNGIIYVIGGESAVNLYETANEAYNPATNTWSTKMPMPTGRRFPAAAALDGMIYTIGGTSSGSSYASTNEAYNPATNLWETKASLPQGQTYGDAVAIDGLLYTIGNGLNPLTTTHYEYNPITDSWSSCTAPNFRLEFAMAAVNNSIYVIGGMARTSLGDNYYWLNEMYVPPLYVYRKD